MRTLERDKLFMVMNYLHSIEDPYQYGDNYGDLVEYLKMLIDGEEEYVPEEDDRIGSEKWLDDIKKNAVMREVAGRRVPPPKFIKWVEENAVRAEVTDDGKVFIKKEAFEEDGIWGLNPYSIQTTLELNEKRLDERIAKLTENVREKVFLTEEYAHAKWKKMCEDKKLHREVREIIHRFKQY